MFIRLLCRKVETRRNRYTQANDVGGTRRSDKIRRNIRPKIYRCLGRVISLISRGTYKVRPITEGFGKGVISSRIVVSVGCSWGALGVRELPFVRRIKQTVLTASGGAAVQGQILLKNTGSMAKETFVVEYYLYTCKLSSRENITKT